MCLVYKNDYKSGLPIGDLLYYVLRWLQLHLIHFEANFCYALQYVDLLHSGSFNYQLLNLWAS